MELTYKNEKKLFVILAVISLIFWIALIGGTLGIGLLYILLAYVAFLFAHSGFISYLKGNGVRITAEQYPDLHASLVRCSEKVGLDKIPDAYILRADVFNALATRFLGRHFVVLYSDVLDALEDRPGAVDFYIGHELGHIHRNHLKWSGFLLPGMVLPLIGTAYRRAEEYTCDRYGTVCCEDDKDVVNALAAIAAGDSKWKSFRVGEFMKQRAETSGFWMSFNELISDYPWLTKRMAAALAFRKGSEVNQPRRHAFAWFLALFVPRLGSGGLVSLMLTIAIIAILAAIAIPAYNGYIQEARMAAAYSAAQPLKAEVVEYAIARNAWPASFTDLGYATDTLINAQPSYEIGLYDDGVIGVHVGEDETGTPRYIVLTPSVTDGRVTWECGGQNVPLNQLPMDCRH